jgi:hypothetical protein
VKALIDQNLSFRLLDALSPRFPGSCHVRDVGLTGDDDERIWRLAKDKGSRFSRKTTTFWPVLWCEDIPHRLFKSASETGPVATAVECRRTGHEVL